jgi:N-acyl-D-amino-acid deacylase
VLAVFDLVFRNATVVDGSGMRGFTADVAVTGDRVAAVGPWLGGEAARSIDATGLVLCPGFIDIHSHADMVAFREDAAALLEPMLRQGITTFVGGNCGIGMAPLPASPHREYMDLYQEAYVGQDLRPFVKWSTLAEFMQTLDAQGVPTNVALLVPHGMLRLASVGPATRHAARDEVRSMEATLAEAMEQGAFGFSCGLQYFPGSQSETGELVSLGRVASRYHGRFACHLRSYSATLDKAVEEALTVGREGGLPVQISHLYQLIDFGPTLTPWVRKGIKGLSAAYEQVPLPLPLDGEMQAFVDKLQAERQSGRVEAHLDAVPTSAGFTHLAAFLPPWALTGSRHEILARLRDPEVRRRMLFDIESGDTRAWPHDRDNTWSMNYFKILGWDGIFIMSVPSERNRPLLGKSLAAIGELWHMHPFDAVCELLLQEDAKVLIFLTYTRPGDDMLELSLNALMADPETAIVTDTLLLGFGLPSTMFYETYPKFLQRYCREKRLASLACGIRKITGLAADCMGIRERGYVKPGYFADLVLLDYGKVRSNSTFEDPCHFPDGIVSVTVNGKMVIDEGRYDVRARAGRVLRHVA